MQRDESVTQEPLGRLPVRDVATRRIYAYRLNIPQLEGFIKVGETTRAVSDRVLEQVTTAGLSDLVEILMDEPAVAINGSGFRDVDVHERLRQLPGVKQKTTGGGVEWFECTIEQVKTAYNGLVAGRVYATVRDKRFGLRDEQRRAVELAHEYLLRANETGREPRFLWNAKMRFGKTFAAYHLAKRMEAKRVLVVTYKPAVEDAWKSDLETHVDFDGWRYFSRESDYDPGDIAPETPLVCFSSLQDLRGRTGDGAIKQHNVWIHQTMWDLVIVDEYHYGAWNDSTKELLSGETGGGSREFHAARGADDEDYAIKDLTERLSNIHGKAILCTSGTPFRALASSEFEADQIFNWTYADEQRAKAVFSEASPGTPNPYAPMPQMHLLVYQLPPNLRTVTTAGTRNEFDLNSFFQAEGEGNAAAFVFKDQVQAWLNWLQGQDVEAVVQAFGSTLVKPFPYADTHILPYMNHTAWFLPSVSSVFAMRNLLREDYNRRFWGQFNVLAVAGPRAGTGVEALPPVRSAIGSGYDSKTITLTCGKLLTGVTIPQWSAILMLSNIEAPETYFQAAFRVQSPWSTWNPDGTNPNEERIRKPACLVVDFAPTRALRLFAEYGMHLGAGTDADEDVRDLRKYLPILGFDGTAMREVDAEEIIDVAFSSTTIDIRRMQSRRFINADAARLARVDPNIRASLRNVAKGLFVPRTDSPVTVINQTNEIADPSIGEASQGPEPDSSELRKEILDESDLADRLMFLATRLNAFMYLSEAIERNLADVLGTDEGQLFFEVMGLRQDEMTVLVKAGLFNEQAMRPAIHQFRRADVEALMYTGLNPRKVQSG
jgi:hypothetical protein